MENIRLQDAAEEDFELLYQIKTRSILPYVDQIWGWEEAVQKEFLRNETPISEVQLIFFEEKAVGFVQLKIKENEVFIGSLFIMDDFQGLGIGSYILDKLIAEYFIVRLEVLKINHRATKLYQSKGLKIVGENELKYFMQIN
ncbi:GNAT family N-acetyltransferase [Rhizosphaericola mali]|uniref:GNAT family N-acetyltransferase n=1 Tax=Rhizosphaericola mali TaxID=2545455 RepID=A0A5P2G2B0_9BACT|nr:GNAT family N-acetyltransferase [Rhizosphaericola mali]QES87970.1 GNAT family N-acetyltransferase [Rhizosphaericola mali]